jgi:hypothetical protein
MTKFEKFVQAIDEATYDIRCKIKNGVEWVKENPVAASVIAGSIATTSVKVASIVRINDERIRRERDFYDPRTGKHTMAKRKPRGSELDEIEWRYSIGESYNSILRDMNLRK